MRGYFAATRRAIDGAFLMPATYLGPLPEAAVEAFGGLRFAVGCAGVGWAEKTVSKRGPHQLMPFETVLRVNLIGPFLAVKYASQVMIPRGKGAIICTASVAGIRSGPTRSITPKKWSRSFRTGFSPRQSRPVQDGQDREHVVLVGGGHVDEAQRAAGGDQLAGLAAEHAVAEVDDNCQRAPAARGSSGKNSRRESRIAGGKKIAQRCASKSAEFRVSTEEG